MTSDLKTTYANRAADLEQARDLFILLTINILAYLVGYWILGGSTLLAEGHEGESWLRPLHGPEFQVSNTVGLYSLIHEALIFCTLPLVPISALIILYSWIRLKVLGHTTGICPH